MSLSPPPYFPLYLHTCFLSPSIWCLCLPSVGVWVMCFPLLASSHTASLVCLAPALPSLYDAFLSEHVSVCPYLVIFFLYRLSHSPRDVPCCVEHISLSNLNLQKSFTFRFSSFAFLPACISVFPSNSVWDSWKLMWLEMLCLSCFAFKSFGFFCDLSFFPSVLSYSSQSVLSCMCVVVSRPRWRTSWRRRCQRKEDAGGSHGEAGTVTRSQ